MGRQCVRLRYANLWLLRSHPVRCPVEEAAQRMVSAPTQTRDGTALQECITASTDAKRVGINESPPVLQTSERHERHTSVTPK